VLEEHLCLTPAAVIHKTLGGAKFTFQHQRGEEFVIFDHFCENTKKGIFQ